MRKYVFLLFYLILLVLLIGVANAVPANPTPFILEQPDGNKFQARQVGDERNAWIETLEEYTIIQDDIERWVYAEKDRYGNLRSSNKIVGKDSPSGLDKHIRPEIIHRIVKDSERKIEIKKDFLGKSTPSYQSAQSQNSPGYSPGTIGTEYIIVIPVQFTDVNFSSGYDQAYYENLIFNESNPRSMNSYYKEVSYGQLSVTGVITPIVTSTKTMVYYGRDGPPDTCGTIDGRYGCIYELAREAVQLTDPSIDFSLYDKDGNGVVDHVVVIHARNGQESSGQKDDIWSHAWYIDDCSDPGGSTCGEQVDGVEVEKYTMMAENSPVGTFAHEFGHDLGLPDLYNTATGGIVVGRWDLMDQGSWNDGGNTPAHISAWGKDQLNWLTSINVTGEINVNINQIETNAEAYRLEDIWLSSVNEYFLVENRQLTGFDSYLPRSGILIWHIDNKQSNNNGAIKKVMPELAGGSLNTAPFASNYGYTFFDSTSTPNTNTNEGGGTTIYAVDIGGSGSSMAATLFGGIARLEPYIITGSGDVTQNQFFNFSSGVNCVGGECGDVSATLKLYFESYPTTCSKIWGFDCSTGPPETGGDNTFDSCSNGAGGDESINEIYLNKNKVGFGKEIEVKCYFTVKSLSCGQGYPGDTVYLYYRNSSTGKWRQIFKISQGYSCNNYSAIFVPDKVEGQHQVRCIADYGAENDECAGGIYYDNDDANFTVINDIISTIPGTQPFYTTSPQPQTCSNMKANDECNLTWAVNATGDLGTYKFFAIFNSNLPLQQQESEKVSITIVETIPEEFISITLESYPINFGNLNPGTTNNIAQNNGNYIVIINPETTVNVDLYQKGNDFVKDSDIINITNMKWYNENNVNLAFIMQASYQTDEISNIAPGTDVNMYYWLSIPERQSASGYTSQIDIKAVKTGNLP